MRRRESGRGGKGEREERVEELKEIRRLKPCNSEAPESRKSSRFTLLKTGS